MLGDLLSSFFTLHLIVNVEVTYLFDNSVVAVGLAFSIGVFVS